MSTIILDDKLKESNFRQSVDTCAPLSISSSEIERIINEIYNDYHSGLIRFLQKRLNSKEDIDDVAQDVYLKLIQYPKLKELKPSLAFLRKIASNILIDRFRNQRARSNGDHIPIDDIEIKSPEGTPEQILRSKEGVEAINTVFNALDKKRRRAFVLNRFKGLTYEEVARKMGMSRSMVRYYISDVLLELSKKFEKCL